MNKLMLGAAVALGLAVGPFATPPAHAAPTHCQGVGTMLLMRPGTWTLYSPAFACGGADTLHASGYYDGLNFTGDFESAACAGTVEGTGTGGVWTGTASSADCGDGTVTITFQRGVAHVAFTFA